ncbi:SH3 domain-containing protein [Ramlibacter sp. H39-3-26]|uniref:SH3 domain-containing protein n=1 Tax=Curvibacter soli TaxID=3031331 RepID=UPI0023D9F0D9|nr:SH3 domain-containing protein [Ramlibacter sp. H39-3-26]MDF1484909.1 SH3 domain-containing protein [Ramlibacter sp. H39-3-26]
MRLSSILRRMALVLAAAAPALAAAEQAYTNVYANLRAGPGPNYPIVAQLGLNTPLEVVGCTAGYQWCDVLLQGGALRGWIYAPSLSYPYQGRTVLLPQYGAVIGVPLISFAIGSYWGSHYRSQPWYGEPRYWGGRPPPRHHLPPPHPNWHPPSQVPPHAGQHQRPPNQHQRPPNQGQRPPGMQRPHNSASPDHGPHGGR